MAQMLEEFMGDFIISNGGWVGYSLLFMNSSNNDNDNDNNNDNNDIGNYVLRYYMYLHLY